MNISNLTTAQLKSIINLKEQIEALEAQMDAIAGEGRQQPDKGTREPEVEDRDGDQFNGAFPRARFRLQKPKRKLSAAHKRKLIKALAKARKMRLAGLKAAKATPKAKKKDRRSSPETRAKLAAAAKARWARVKAEGKTTL